MKNLFKKMILGMLLVTSGMHQVSAMHDGFQNIRKIQNKNILKITIEKKEGRTFLQFFINRILKEKVLVVIQNLDGIIMQYTKRFIENEGYLIPNELEEQLRNSIKQITRSKFVNRVVIPTTAGPSSFIATIYGIGYGIGCAAITIPLLPVVVAASAIATIATGMMVIKGIKRTPSIAELEITLQSRFLQNTNGSPHAHRQKLLNRQRRDEINPEEIREDISINLSTKSRENILNAGRNIPDLEETLNVIDTDIMDEAVREAVRRKKNIRDEIEIIIKIEEMDDDLINQSGDPDSTDFASDYEYNLGGGYPDGDFYVGGYMNEEIRVFRNKILFSDAIYHRQTNLGGNTRFNKHTLNALAEAMNDLCNLDPETAENLKTYENFTIGDLLDMNDIINDFEDIYDIGHIRKKEIVGAIKAFKKEIEEIEAKYN